MNKAEKKMLADLREQAALRWTVPVEPDVPIPVAAFLDKDYVKGWDYNAHDFGRVFPLWSGSVSHGDLPINPGYRSGSRGGLRLYSTRLLALRALRYAMETEAARRLASVDAQIAAEEASPTPLPEPLAEMDGRTR